VKSLILAFCLFLAGAAAHAQAPIDAALKRQVDGFLNAWHDDAAKARPAFFDKMAKDGVYIGTDKTEVWSRDEFKTWTKGAFGRKSAWTFKPIKRNVYASPDKSIIWFDEQLDTEMGICQASGVIRKTPAGFEIVHYQLSMAVPNEVGGKVTWLIKEHEAKAAGKGSTR
jgi:hypothetical protein